MSCALPSSLDETHSFFQHVALILVRQRLHRVAERKPADFLHFVVMVGRVAGETFQQEQVHRLEHAAPISLGIELIRDLAQLANDPGVQAGLFPHFPHGRLLEVLPLFDPAFRQRPCVALRAGHPDQGHLGRLVRRPGRSEHDAAGRDAVGDHRCRQYWIRAWISQPSICARPLSDSSSTRKASPTISPPSWRTRLTVAAAVPPVASRSSTISTRSPIAIESRCTASELDPYSRLYLTSKISAGSLPGFRTGTKPAPNWCASGAPRINPRDSIPTTLATLCVR